MLVDGADLTVQKSMHLLMVVSIVVEMVEQTAAVATVVAMAFEEHEGGHTGDGVVDGDGVAGDSDGGDGRWRWRNFF